MAMGSGYVAVMRGTPVTPAADSISSIAKPVVSWDHHNLLISTIHEGVPVLGEK